MRIFVCNGCRQFAAGEKIRQCTLTRFNLPVPPKSILVLALGQMLILRATSFTVRPLCRTQWIVFNLEKVETKAPSVCHRHLPSLDPQAQEDG